MIDIKVYTKTTCGWCNKVKNWLTENDLSFKEIKLDDDDERKMFYESCLGQVKSVPQIFINGARIGGFSELMKHKNMLLASKIKFTSDF